jgi:tRNA(Ile)-lysidine synthase
MNQRLNSFARRLLSEWKRLDLPIEDARVVVAVSGGADSTALLLALNELTAARRLGLEITVAHLDHGLRGEASKEDSRWVADLTRDLGYAIAVEKISAGAVAAAERDNLEQAARRERYQLLSRVASGIEAFAVLTGHTMDDQAETVVLRLMRGSGVDGLSGMARVRSLSDEGRILLVRPLLGWARRAETEEYCVSRGVSPRWDSMNDDEGLSRVRVRKQLLPLMGSFNPRVVEALSRAAGLLRDDAEALSAITDQLLEAAGAAATSAPSSLRVEVLSQARPSVRRRALRRWLVRERGDTRRLSTVHLLEVEKLVFGERGGRIAELPGGSRVERRKGHLLFHPAADD